MLEFIDRYAALIEPSAKLNGLRWPEAYSMDYIYRESSFDNVAAVAGLKKWIVERVAYLRSRLDSGQPY